MLSFLLPVGLLLFIVLLLYASGINRSGKSKRLFFSLGSRKYSLSCSCRQYCCYSSFGCFLSFSSAAIPQINNSFATFLLIDFCYILFFEGISKMFLELLCLLRDQAVFIRHGFAFNIWHRFLAELSRSGIVWRTLPRARESIRLCQLYRNPLHCWVALRRLEAIHVGKLHAEGKFSLHLGYLCLRPCLRKTSLQRHFEMRCF